MDDDGRIGFRETTRTDRLFRSIAYAAMTVGAIALLWAALAVDAWQAETLLGVLVGAMVLLMLATLVRHFRIHVRVEDGAVVVRPEPFGFLARRIPVEGIEAAEVLEFGPEEVGGIAGRVLGGRAGRGVRLRLRDGQLVALSSAKPEAMLAAIRAEVEARRR